MADVSPHSERKRARRRGKPVGSKQQIRALPSASLERLHTARKWSKSKRCGGSSCLLP